MATSTGAIPAASRAASQRWRGMLDLALSRVGAVSLRWIKAGLQPALKPVLGLADVMEFARCLCGAGQQGRDANPLGSPRGPGLPPPAPVGIPNRLLQRSAGVPAMFRPNRCWSKRFRWSMDCRRDPYAVSAGHHVVTAWDPVAGSRENPPHSASSHSSGAGAARIASNSADTALSPASWSAPSSLKARLQVSMYRPTSIPHRR